MVTVRGAPLWTRKIVESCHPPGTRHASPRSVSVSRRTLSHFVSSVSLTVRSAESFGLKVLKNAGEIEEIVRDGITRFPKGAELYLRPMFWASDGFVSNEDTRTCIRLLGEEVLPALREIGKELGLWSPFEANAPVSRAFPEPARPAGAG